MGVTLIFTSSIARNSSAPNAKILFEILCGILEGRKVNLIFTCRSPKYLFQIFGANYLKITFYNPESFLNFSGYISQKLGVCCRPCNPSKWGAEFWGWLEVWRPALLCFTVNRCLHWPCWQYGHSGETKGWLGVRERVIWAVGYIQQHKALFWRAVVGFAGEWAQSRFPDQK